MNGICQASRSRLSGPGAFFVFTFLWSWSFWLMAILYGSSASGLVTISLQLIAGIGPMIAGISLTFLAKGTAGLRELMSGSLDVRRIRGKWYLIIFLIVPVLTLFPVLIDLLAGTSPNAMFPGEYLSQPWMLLPFALFTLLFGPLPEELGRFGFAIDSLQSRHSALISSVILGMTWAVWHLPLFFIEGTYQHDIGIGSTGFWLYMIVMVPENIVMTWIYNNNERSVLSAVLVHFMINFAGELVLISELAETGYVGSWIALALLVCVLYGPQYLARARAGGKKQEKQMLA